MSLHRFRPAAVPAIVVAALLTLSAPHHAQAACPLREAYDKSRTDWEAAHKAFRDIRLEPGIDAKLSVVAGLVDVTLAGGGEDFDQMLLADQTLTQAEKDAYLMWLRQKKEAYKKVITSREAMQDAGKAWREALDRKDEALTKADALVRQEQAWLASEKEALSKMQVNSPEYLDRASKILERLKQSYADVDKGLGRFRDCFEDADAFLDDLDTRMARVAEVEAEIAKRRGGAGAAAGPAPGNPWVQPGARTWTCAGAEVKVLRDTNGWLTSKGPGGASWIVIAPDGTKGTATVTIEKPPKLKLTAGEPAELIMTGTAQLPAWADALWMPGDWGGGQGFDNDGGFIQTGDNRFKAVWHRQFIGHDPRGAPCYMRAMIGRNIGNGVYDPHVQITWTYTIDPAPDGK